MLIKQCGAQSRAARPSQGLKRTAGRGRFGPERKRLPDRGGGAALPTRGRPRQRRPGAFSIHSKRRALINRLARAGAAAAARGAGRTRFGSRARIAPDMVNSAAVKLQVDLRRAPRLSGAPRLLVLSSNGSEPRASFDRREV